MSSLLRILKFLGLILGITAVILTISILTAQGLVFYYAGDVAAWVQAVGAILAIVAGFATAAYQTRAQKQVADDENRALVQAACLLAFEALETVCDRLDTALATGERRKPLSLQGDRTTEMILAMREFDTTRLPAIMLSHFIRLRSHVFAINERIGEIYSSEERSGPNKREKSERPERLKSSVRVRANAIVLFNELQSLAIEFGVNPKQIGIQPKLPNHDPD